MALPSPELPHDLVAPFDAQVIEDLLPLDGGRVLSHVMHTFLRTSQEVVRDLERADASMDAEGLRRLAHRLKGSARTVGLRQLGDAAASLERLAASADAGRLPGARATVANEYRRALEAVHRLIVVLPSHAGDTGSP